MKTEVLKYLEILKNSKNMVKAYDIDSRECLKYFVDGDKYFTYFKVDNTLILTDILEEKMLKTLILDYDDIKLIFTTFEECIFEVFGLTVNVR